MAKRERVETDTICDRCARKVTASGARVTLMANPLATSGVMLAGLDEPGVDLCRACFESAQKWWARGGGGEA